MTKIVIFGEDLNDARAIKELVLGLCPDLDGQDVKVLRDPPTLQRGAREPAVRGWAEGAAAAISALRTLRGDPACVLAHSDSDAPDFDGSFERQRTAELRAAGLDHAHAVVPVESIESWWLLYPKATESIVPTWGSSLDRRPGDVDRVSNPKAELRRRTRKKQPKRPYEEADSPGIARAIVDGGYLGNPSGTSGSFSRFRRVVERCCERARRH